jgi:hypothetical protein
MKICKKKQLGIKIHEKRRLHISALINEHINDQDVWNYLLLLQRKNAVPEIYICNIKVIPTTNDLIKMV